MTKPQASAELIEMGAHLAASIVAGTPSMILAESFQEKHAWYRRDWWRLRAQLPDANDQRLSKREREAVGRFNACVSLKDVATQMGISLGTLQIHLRHARMKCVDSKPREVTA